MEQFGAFYAKTHFSELLEGAAKGKKYLISRHGHIIAMMIPFSEDRTLEEQGGAAGAIRAIKNLRTGTRLGKDLSIKTLKSEGRA